MQKSWQLSPPEHYVRKAERLRETPPTDGVAAIKIANCFKRGGAWTDADHYYRLAAGLFEQQRNPVDAMLAYRRCARMNEKLGNIAMAASLRELAFSVVRDEFLAHMFRTERHLVRAAWLYAQCARYEKALTCIAKMPRKKGARSCRWCTVLCQLALGRAEDAQKTAVKLGWQDAVLALTVPADAPRGCAQLAERVAGMLQNKT